MLFYRVVLQGDVDGTGDVGGSDMSTIKSSLFKSLEDGYWRYDIDLNGEIGGSDMSTVKASLFNSASCP